jgi:4a-hydroxytetrahydrobiopterin dehydratase
MGIPKGWSEKDGALIFAVKCKDFTHALALLNSVGDIAEQLKHHPDLGIRSYNEVFVTTKTHEANSITSKDYELANRINSLLDYQESKKNTEKYGTDLSS